MAAKKKKIYRKFGGLCTYISDILPELNMRFSKIFCALKILIYNFYSTRRGFGFQSCVFCLAGDIGGRQFLREGILYSANELFHNGEPFGTIFSGLITSLWMTSSLKD